MKWSGKYEIINTVLNKPSNVAIQLVESCWSWYNFLNWLVSWHGPCLVHKFLIRLRLGLWKEALTDQKPVLMIHPIRNSIFVLPPPLMLNTGTPQGRVLSPLLYSLYPHDWASPIKQQY